MPNIDCLQACRLRNFPLRAMESDQTPAAAPEPFAMPCGADTEPAGPPAAEEDDTADGVSRAAEHAAATVRRPSLQLPLLSPAGAETPEPPLPEPTRTDSPTLPREGPPFREVTPFAVRAAVRDTLTAASLQNPALAPAGPSVRASADSTAAMAAILRQFTAHLRNQPAPSKSGCSAVIHIIQGC